MEEFWFKNAIFYALPIRAFQDSNGDGIGDIRGLISRLDYLADLGITCVWILPHYPTPYRDHGYDISDYYGVDPRLGTLQDFNDFVHQAGERGIRVIVDLVASHTSDQHPWFQAARRSRTSRFRDYYIWSRAPQPSWRNVPVSYPGSDVRVWPEVYIAFPESEKSLWTYDSIAGEYYYHLFYRFQPDLNTAHPGVMDEILRVVDFWLTTGVSGFRLDAVGSIIDKRLAQTQSLDEALGILAQIRHEIAKHRTDGVLLGEADLPPDQLAACFGRGERANLLLNFLISQYLYLAFAKELAEPVHRVLDLVSEAPQGGQWVNFLRNLDELNLSKISEDERAIVFEKFGSEQSMQLYKRGIRRRVAPMFDGDRRRLEMAYSLLFSLPGSPMITYGDEIGMGEDLSLWERNSVRTPMQWNAGENAGFSTAPADNLIRPVVSAGAFGYPTLNVELQHADPESLLNWMRKLILVRRTCPEIGWGRHERVDSGHPAVHAQRVRWKGKELLTLHNLSGETVIVTVQAGERAGVPAVTLLGEARQEWVSARDCRMTLEPYGYAWFRTDAAVHEMPAPETLQVQASANGLGKPAEITTKAHERT